MLFNEVAIVSDGVPLVQCAVLTVASLFERGRLIHNAWGVAIPVADQASFLTNNFSKRPGSV